MKGDPRLKALLTIPEVASRLALGRSHVYQLIMRGEIPSIKIGKSRRVPAGTLEEFIERRLREQAVASWANGVGLTDERGRDHD